VIPATSAARYGLGVTPPGPSLQARLAVALPPLDQRARRSSAEQDWHPELLDAHDPDDRATLIRLAHPDLDEAIAQDLAELRVDGVPINPRLHPIVHEMVATQIIDDDPPEAFQTAQRLLALGRDPHEVLHMLGSVASTQIRTALHEQQQLSREDHLVALAALPERWDAQARHEPARPPRTSSGARRPRRR